MTERPTSRRRSAPALPALIVLGAIAALVVSLLAGTPDDLPGVALGSEVLLHAERTLALTASGVFLLSVIAQATRGRLPDQLSTSGLGYSETDEGLQEQVNTLVLRLDELERRQSSRSLEDQPDPRQEPRQ